MRNLFLTSPDLFRLLLTLVEVGGTAGRVLPDRLWEHHHHLLALLRYRTGNADVAEDLLQETYIAFLNANPAEVKFSDDKALRNYLITIAINKVTDYFRRGANRPEFHIRFRTHEDLDNWLDSLADPTANHEEAIVNTETDDERRNLVALVMEGLSPQYRAVLQGKFNQEKTNPELAEQLGLSVKALESLLFRAKAAFRKEFEKRSLNSNEKPDRNVHVNRGGLS